MKVKEKLLVGSWRMNYHVATVASLTPDQAQTLLFGNTSKDEYATWYEFAPRDLLVMIDYPLDPGIQVRIPDNMYSRRDTPSLGRFLLAIAREYQEIYRRPAKYGIWGHGLSDLYFERVTVAKDGAVELAVGS